MGHLWERRKSALSLNESREVKVNFEVVALKPLRKQWISESIILLVNKGRCSTLFKRPFSMFLLV